MNENAKISKGEKLGDIVENALNSIKEIADVNTVIGEPIVTSGDVTIIPVSNVSVGFASGGVDSLGKRSSDKASSMNFAGGGGTGIKISPVGFLVIKPDGDVSFLGMTAIQKPDKLDTLLEMLERSPEIITKFRTAFSKNKDEAKLQKEETESSDDKKA